MTRTEAQELAEQVLLKLDTEPMTYNANRDARSLAIYLLSLPPIKGNHSIGGRSTKS